MKTENVEVVSAVPADAVELTRIAHAAKAHWGYPAAALAEWRDALTVTPPFIAANEVCKAIAGKIAIGFYALGCAGGLWRLEHLWVLPDWIGHGVGAALFQHAVARAAELGVTRLTIESDPNAEGFYLRMGAHRAGTSQSELAGKPRELPLFEVPISPA